MGLDVEGAAASKLAAENGCGNRNGTGFISEAPGLSLLLLLVFPMGK